MSEVSNKINIDVGDVLKKGSNEIGMAELNKMGLKKVKVIKHSQVQELISQAVENAISRFIFGAEGRKEHERLMSLISEKENALSDVSGVERSELKNEVESLKKKMQEQAQRLEEAKAKVIEETKKEYEALAEKTSLENQLIMKEKSELELHRQLQEMTMLMGQLKEKVRNSENEQSAKYQELAKLPVLEEQLSTLESENEELLKEVALAKEKIEAEKQKNIMAAKAISEKLKQSEELYAKISKLEAEKQKAESEHAQLKESIREKEFALKEYQSKAERLQTDKEDIIKNAKSSQTGLDSELKKAYAEKDSALQKVSQLESTASTLKDQLREKDFSIREMQMKAEHLQSEKVQALQLSTQLETQISALKESLHEAKLVAEKVSLKEEAAREKAEAMKGNLSAVTLEKEKAVASLAMAKNEIESLQKTIEELNQQIVEKSNEDKNSAMLEAIKLMMTDMKGEFAEKLDKAKLRGGGGGGGNNNDNTYVEMDPAVILKNMFAEKVESNFGKVELESRKTPGKKDFGKNLDALKNLKGNKKEE